MSLNGRLKRLEESTYSISPEDKAKRRQANNQRFLEGIARDFEALVPKVVPRIDAGLASRAHLEHESPRVIAAVYAVLRSRNDPRAEEMKEIHETVMEQRRQHPHYAELERISPGTPRALNDWFWELVERYAESNENRL
jgi:hypothetical protein